MKPEGYRKKKKKKKSTTTEPNEDEMENQEDTSIITKNPYGDNQSDSDEEENSRDNKRGKTKSSPYKKGSTAKSKGRKKVSK